jgi:hypothetical protein
MNLRSLVFSPGAMALLLGLGSGRIATAADEPPPRVAAPVTVPDCPACAGAPSPGCATCNTSKMGGHKHCKPYVPQLCPGACFGYFQTQWHRWEDVCPLPYQGVGLTDAPPEKTPTLMAPAPLLLPTTDPKSKGSDAPAPKPPLNPVPPSKGAPVAPPKVSTVPPSDGISVPPLPSRY